MTIRLRVDASRETGLGHLQRCLALASAPAWRGEDVGFVVQGDEAAMERIEARGFRATLLPPAVSPADDRVAVAGLGALALQRIAVIDSRTVDAAYRSTLRRMGVFVVSIDDLAIAPLPSDVVVNSNVFAPGLDYEPLAPGAELFLGLEFALLQPEFWRLPAREVAAHVRRVLIVLGAADRLGMMPSLLEAIACAGDDFAVDVVIGPLFHHAGEVRQVAARRPDRVRLIESPSSLLQPMRDADLAVSAGGQTLHELVRVGCPTIAFEMSHDQRAQIDAFARLGCVRHGGASGNSFDRLITAFRELCADRAARVALATLSQQQVDGQGVVRISEAILRLAALHRGTAARISPAWEPPA